MTVGELRDKLRYSKDEELLIFRLDDKEVQLVAVSSSGGGRITIVWFDEKKTGNP